MMGPKSVPNPGSTAVQEALELMRFLGGDNKAGAKLLNEMRDVQKCNEKLLAEVKDAINQLARAQAKLDKSQQKLENDAKAAETTFATRKQALYQLDADLNAKTKAFDLVTKARVDDYDRKSSKLNAREANVAKREAADKAFAGQLDARAEKSDKAEAALDAWRDDLDKRDRRLRKAMGG